MNEKQHESSHSLESDFKVGIELTSTAIESLDLIAKKTGLSHSELIESIIQGNLSIASNTASNKIVLTVGQSEIGRGNTITEIDLVNQAQSDLEIEIQDLRDEIKKYQSLKSVNEEQGKLITELASRLKQQDDVSGGLKNSQAVELEKTLSEERAKITILEQKYQDIEQKSVAKDTRISRLQAQLTEQQTQGEGKYRDVNRSLQQKNQELALRVEKLQKDLDREKSRVERIVQIYQSLQKESQAKDIYIKEIKEEASREKKKYFTILQQSQAIDTGIKELEKRLIQQRESNEIKDTRIRDLEEEATREKQKYVNILEQSRAIDTGIKELEKRLNEQRENNQKLEVETEQKDLRILELEQQLNQQEEKYQTMQEQSVAIDTGIKEVEKQLTEQIAKYKALKSESENKDARINELELELDLREDDNQELRQKIEDQEFSSLEGNESDSELVSEIERQNILIQSLQAQLQGEGAIDTATYESLQQQSLDKDVQIIRLQEELEKIQGKSGGNRLKSIFISIIVLSLLGLAGGLSYYYFYYLKH